MRQIPEQASITSIIREAIASSRIFLAFYSSTYPESNPCQEEIATAWLATQRLGESPNGRIWIVNPEQSFDHIPNLFRDQQSGPVVEETVRQLKQALVAVSGTLPGRANLPSYHGMSAIQASRFIGRGKQFWDLHGKLMANRISIITGVHGQTAAQVRGLGGNGKSLLAREYAIRFGSAYPGGVFWLNAYGHDDSLTTVNADQRKALRQTQIREFAIECGVPVEGLDPEEIEVRFWRVLQNQQQNCLWIIDDVPAGITSDEFSEICRVGWTGTSTLITTRSKEHGAVGSTLDLGVLSPAEALRLLYLHHAPTNPAEETAAQRIVELLGFHPLAVDVAGSYLAFGAESMAGFVEALENPTEDAMEFGALLKESLPTGHELSISATLLKSIRQLGSEGLDFLRLASILAVAPIPIALLSDTLAIADSENIAKKYSVKAVAQAEALSLCERFGNDTRTVHTLVSRTMRFKYPNDVRTEQLHSAAMRALMHRIYAASHHGHGQHSAVVMDIAHARHLAPEGAVMEEQIALALCLAQFDFERGDYDHARQTQEHVLAIRRERLGEEHEGTLAVTNNLARTLYAQGKTEKARVLQEHVREISIRVFGEGHPNTVTSTSNLALTLYSQGYDAEAEALERQVLAQRIQLFGQDSPETLVARNNLAQTLRARGNVAEAFALQEQVMRASCTVLGNEHPDTLKAKSNFAWALHTAGRYTEARILQERVLNSRRNLLGDNNHPDTLKAMSRLALTAYAQGDWTSARLLQAETLKINARILGDEHPETLAAANDLALTLCSQGDLAGARVLIEDVLATRRRVFGERHPDTLTILGNLAQICGASKQFEEASNLHKSVLAARRDTLGENHPDTLSAMNNLAQALSAMGDLAEARPLQELAFEGIRNRFGERHPTTVAMMNNLGAILYHQGELTVAQSLQEQALEICRDSLGEMHHATLTTMNNLAQTVYKLGRRSNAILMQQQVVSGRRNVLGDEHPDTVQAINILSWMTGSN
ncbi:MAG TPA: tetratricopeptide repeat protein [Bryobacteraceae bacterium]